MHKLTYNTENISYIGVVLITLLVWCSSDWRSQSVL